MELSITFRHVPPSDALKRCVEERLARIERVVRPTGLVHVVLDVERNEHQAELVIPLEGHVLVAHAVRGNLQEALDAATAKALEQARRHQSRRHNRREEGGRALKAAVA